jgi:hypothetical protein
MLVLESGTSLEGAPVEPESDPAGYEEQKEAPAGREGERERERERESDFFGSILDMQWKVQER